jgi:Protein of unknown function (DUF2817)
MVWKEQLELTWPFVKGDLMTPTVSQYFSRSYQEARTKFLSAAAKHEAAIQSIVHPDHQGLNAEALAMDALRIGASDANSLIVLTSAVHGVEGFCGSGCQVGLLHDQELLGRLGQASVALLVIHAVNPYGFSYLRRVNEGNIDLNRNFLNYTEPLPVNTGYAQVRPLVVPQQWPPTEQNTAAIASYIQEHGARQFQNAVSTGQSTHADGLFYSGQTPAWSNSTLRHLLRANRLRCQQIAWLDIHTGLGPTGHGEKIYAGRDDNAELDRARACWGADVFSPFTGDSFSEAVRGSATQSLYDECPDATTMAMALEYGTQDFTHVMTALRADQWLTNQGHTSGPQYEQIKQAIVDAFYVDTAEWRGMVYAQTRVAVLQAITALAKYPRSNGAAQLPPKS